MRHQWTEAEDAHILNQRQAGVSSAAIGATMSKTKDQVKNRLGTLDLQRARLASAPDPEVVPQRWQPVPTPIEFAPIADIPEKRTPLQIIRSGKLHKMSRKIELEDLGEDFLHPRFFAPAEPVPVTSGPTERTVIAGDFHFPFACPRALAIFYEAVRQLRPRRILINGDTTDLNSLSSYPKDYRSHVPLKTEQDQTLAFWHTLHTISQEWGGAELIEIEANHSGEGRESRFARWLSDNMSGGLRELMSLPHVAHALSYRTLFHPAGLNIQLRDNYELSGDLLVVHGSLARKGGGNTARAHADAWMGSVLHNHTHRMGSSIRRIPAKGSRVEGVVRAYENASMCELDPEYGSISCPADWTNGFSIHEAGPDGSYALEQVVITGGAATIAALGTTLRA